MPAPKKDEKKPDYISRCVPFIIKEDNGVDDSKQATAICYELWDKAKEAKMNKHSFASMQIDIPKKHPISEAARNIYIPKTWLHDHGIEKDTHVTVKYGLDDPKALSKIRNILSQISPFDIKFREISLFETVDYDVIKVDISSPELRYIHRKISEIVNHDDQNALYRPHMTLAYVWPGKGKPVVNDWFYGSDSFNGSVYHVSEITYSDENGRKTIIPLGNNEMKKNERLILEAVLAPVKQEKELTGIVWEVTLIGPKTPEHLITVNGEKFVRSENMRLYPVKMMEESTPDWDGIKVYDNHLTDEEFIKKQGMRSPGKEWLGTIVEPWFDSKESKLKAIFKLVEDALARKLKNAWDQDVLKSIGLSIDTFPQSDREVIFEGTSLPVVDGFDRIVSVDLVGDPAAGGSLDRLIASTQKSIKETKMNKEEVLEIVNESLDEKLDGLSTSVTSAVLEALAGNDDETPDPEAKEKDDDDKTPDPEAKEKDDDDKTPDPEAKEKDDESDLVAEAVRESKLTRCEFTLYRTLESSKLPKEMAATIHQAFEGRIFKTAELNQMVKNMKKAQAALDPSGRVQESNYGRNIQMLANGYEQAEIDFIRLVAGHNQFEKIKASDNEIVKERIPESFNSWIKGGRKPVQVRRVSEWAYNLLGGNPLTDERAYEAVTTSGMTSIVKNALNLILAADYSVREQWWDPIVTYEEVDTIDQATLVRVYGMDTLDVVGEGQPYTELTWEDEEETADFVKKGNYAGITLETILRDKLNIIRSIPQRLSNSWYNTLSSLVSAVFTTNTAAGPILADGAALFNNTAVGTPGGHANLLVAALGTTTASYAASRLAMMKQTDQTLGTGRRNMIRPRFLLGPVDLENQALQLMNTREVPGSANNDINPYFGESQVIPVPDWTDPNNWAFVADPALWPAIWLIFPTGQRVPQLFTSDSEVAGAMFTNDTLRYKIRMLTYRFSSTYDCAPVSDFRPLHKNNVS